VSLCDRDNNTPSHCGTKHLALSGWASPWRRRQDINQDTGPLRSKAQRRAKLRMAAFVAL